MATTVDHATGGRLMLGIGAGWYEPDHAGSGLPFPSAAERLDHLAEAVALMRYCWSGADTGFAGRHYSAARGLPSLPGPVNGTIPLLIGGNGQQAMRLAARYADEWNVYAPTYHDFPSRSRRFDQYRAEAGRPPGSVRKTLHLPFSVASTRAEAERRCRTERRGVSDLAELVAAGSIIAGTVPEVTQQMRRYLIAGADGFVLGCEPPFDSGALTLLAREVIPALLPL